MNDALFGYTGLVGSTLLRQRAFSATYRSTTIQESRGACFDTVVCAAAPAQKWIANQKPAEDEATIRGLIENLSTIQCRWFVLVSTVDVFADPVGVDEDTPVAEAKLAPYGKNRRLLERAVNDLFAECLIVRLPGLVGPGLKKNVIFDLHNNNNLGAIDSRGVFQFYPLVNLWADISTAQRAGLSCVHLTAEPMDVAGVAENCFGKQFRNEITVSPPRYDLQTRYGGLYQRADGKRYQYSAREALLAIRAYAQSEPRRSEVSL